LLQQFLKLKMHKVLKPTKTALSVALSQAVRYIKLAKYE
jgi:hypothetical protein